MPSDHEGASDALDKIQYPLPVGDSTAIDVANAGRVVNQEHDVGHGHAHTR